MASTVVLLQTMDGHGNAVTCMLITSRLMYTGSADSTARCWVVEFGDCTRQYKGHKHTVICMKCDKGIRTSDCTYSVALV